MGSAFEVSKALGAGFLEKVYELAMLRQLTLRGVSAKTQASFPVCYQGQYGGEYCADLVVDQKVIVEWKCVDRLGNEHLAQPTEFGFRGFIVHEKHLFLSWSLRYDNSGIGSGFANIRALVVISNTDDKCVRIDKQESP